jgi:hypothetical protein
MSRAVWLPVAADGVLSAMESRSKPCDDFYAFVCGHFGDSHPIPEGQLLWDNFLILQDAMDGLSRSKQIHCTWRSLSLSLQGQAMIFKQPSRISRNLASLRCPSLRHHVVVNRLFRTVWKLLISVKFKCMSSIGEQETFQNCVRLSYLN